MIVAFLVGQIRFGKVTYQQIITSRPDIKNQIDEFIISKELNDLIDKTV